MSATDIELLDAPTSESNNFSTKDLLNPGFSLTLRPMRYPLFFDMFKDAIKNTWTVEEINFQTDLSDIAQTLTPAEIHLIQRLVAFFATGDSIVSNNLVLNLYKHINSPEGRLYLSRQLFEEAVHVQFYLNLLDNYIPNPDERIEAFAAVDNIPSIAKKADFCLRWIDSIEKLDRIETVEQRKQFLLNLVAFAACIEGMFFFAAFAYVYYFRSKGLLHGLASGTNWVFRDRSCLPAETDILTARGFTPIENLFSLRESGVELAVAQYCEDGTISFVMPEAYVAKEHRGMLNCITKDKALNLVTTPDHDNVIRSTTTGKIKKSKASSMKFSSTAQILCAGAGIGRRRALSDWERFAIAFQADGHRQTRYDGSRSGYVPIKFTFEKDRKIRRFRKIVDALGWPFTIRQNVGEGILSVIRSLGRDAVSAELRPSVATRSDLQITIDVPVEFAGFDKEFNWINLAELNLTWGQEFFEELGEWDSYLGKGDRTCIQYINTNLEAVEKVQAIAAISGYACNRYEVEDDRKDTFKNRFNLFIKKRDYVQLHKATREELLYNGTVYCVSVPSGMIVIRQEGKVHVTGNCPL